MKCLAGWVITHILVTSVQLQPGIQSSSDITGDISVWGQSETFSSQGPINEVGALN